LFYAISRALLAVLTINITNDNNDAAAAAAAAADDDDDNDEPVIIFNSRLVHDNISLTTALMDIG